MRKPRLMVVRRRSLLRASAIERGAYYLSEPRQQRGPSDSNDRQGKRQKMR